MTKMVKSETEVKSPHLTFIQVSCSLPHAFTHRWTLKSCKTTMSSCYGLIETGCTVFLHGYGSREWVLHLFHHNSLLFPLSFHCFLPGSLSFSSVAEWSHMGRWQIWEDWKVALRFSFFHFLPLSHSFSLSNLVFFILNWFMKRQSVFLQSKQGRR